MVKYYVVLFGSNGAKNFNTLQGAREFAQMKANQTNQNIEIDVVSEYPNARVGQVDWSQGYHSTVKPFSQNFSLPFFNFKQQQSKPKRWF